MDKDNREKPHNVADKLEIAAQIGSLIFGALLTAMQITRAIKGNGAQ